MTKAILGLLAAGLGFVFGASLAGAATLPVQGSFFASGLVSGTNAVWVPAATSTTTAVTNYPASNGIPVEVTGNNGMQIVSQLVQISAGGNTNNGGLYLQFALSNDGVNYTTLTNGCQVYVPTRGTSYDIWATNIAASVLGNSAYVRLYSAAQTNIGGLWLSNLTYRFLQTK